MSDAALATSLSFALTAGVATFFSPCAYPLLPGYVGFYVNRTDSDGVTLRGAGARGIAAGLGVLATFSVLSGVTLAAGHAALSNSTFLEVLVGAALVAFGLLVVTGSAPSITLALPKRRSGILGFGIFGAGYALAGAGCVAPVFLAVVTHTIVLPPGSAALVLATYAGVVAVLMVSVTVATGIGLLTGAGLFAPHAKTIERLAGVVMILAGLGQLSLALFVYR
ncbi:cytochrome c biogenesis protein CcdA [Natronobeatus ordinarius]|uniref:cytochrome c biogenesis protein CcdA n=1 Tax=Natronobeatus ordinarius TaxID=2963433 RepID=UPI0020CECBA6|nr:cytochrome c biogenesis protein CcdA [Natronobeatus ordinarius]